MKYLKLLLFIFPLLIFINSSSSQPPKPGNDFKVCIGGRIDGKVPASFFAENTTIVPYKLKTSFKVISYRLTIVTKGRKKQEFETKGGNQLTPEMSAALTDLPQGSKVYFEFILLKNKNGKATTARPMIFTIN